VTLRLLWGPVHEGIPIRPSRKLDADSVAHPDRPELVENEEEKSSCLVVLDR